MFRYTYIDKAGNLLCDVSEYVRKHNVVYRTPAMLPREGLPLGNGFMGGLVYHTDRELCMRINRTDSFDYARKPGRFGAWGHEWEEECTTLASCGTVKISDGTPAFAWEYLDDYENTLDLGRAEIGMRSETPFSSWRAKGYGSPDDRVIVWEIEAESEEPLARTVRLERYGTRGFFHYYESFTRETSRRLYGVEAKAADDCMLVTQKLNGCVFTTAVRVECEGARYQVLNRREAECVLPKAEKAAFRVVIATADGTYGVRGFVTDAMAGLHSDYFYACGPEPMLKAVYRATEISGQFSFEARMVCGFGACMGCSCKTITGYKRICREGPVLEKEEILWEN